jgi:ABC-type multidrug transport system fused ATPase/permease subunit
MQALKEQQGQSTTGPISIPQIPKRSGSLRCPRCDSSRIRNRSWYFLISIIVFGALWLLINAGVVLVLVMVYGSQIVESISFLKSTIASLSSAIKSMPFLSSIIEFLFLAASRLFLIVLALLVIWPTVICATACFALIGKHRCLSCGHRFRPIHKKEQTKLETPFPLRFCILNGVILFLICVASWEMLKLISHGAFSIILFDAILAALGAAFLIGLSLPYQVIIYRLFRTRIRHNLLWAILFLLPAIIFGSISFYQSLPTVRAPKVLSYGRLAPLPESASDIKVYSWSSLFAGEWFLRFSATSEDIEDFLNMSPSIKDAECVMYSREKMRLPYPEDYWQNNKYSQDGHEYFDYHQTEPGWYKPEIRGRGRYYRIRPKAGFKRAEVIVDDEKDLVFIRVIWS